MNNFNDTYEDEEDFGPSKSEIKKQMQALQALGEKLVGLSEGQLAQVGLEGRLAEAVYEARKMKHREGRRRQLQFIGKLMREADHESIQSKFEQLSQISRSHTKIQHKVEQWRDRLITEGNSALQEFIAEHSQCDVQHLRQLVRNSTKEASQNKPPASARKLFRYIREILEGINQ